jgi:hypothetical protein
MCEDSVIERLYWLRKVEQLRQDMEREASERQRRAPAATPAKPGDKARDPEPVPV